MHTPGHSPGHVSLLHEPTGVLITGDAIFNDARHALVARGALHRRRAHPADAPTRLGELDYDVAAFTHGPEIRDGAPRGGPRLPRRRLTAAAVDGPAVTHRW